MQMRTVSIVGFGRFGKVLYKLLKDDFIIKIYDRSSNLIDKSGLEESTIICDSPKEIYESKYIFYCVPISKFEKIILDHKQYFNENVLIDVLSVKLHPLKIFRKYLSETYSTAILTHPMFGPDSSSKGFKGLPIVLNNFNASSDDYNLWKKFFKNKGLKIVEMTARRHDRLAANSQGVTHFIGRVLNESTFIETEIDTAGAKKLQEVIDMTCNDTWELFQDLQNYNPYTKEMRVRLGKAYDKLYLKLLPKRVQKDNLIFGIQGGLGSFNEEAINKYLTEQKIKNAKIKYLYTSESVLKNLHRGNIDYGQFALENTLGGIVGESLIAMAKYKFEIVYEFYIQIRHFLMIKSDVDFNTVDTIMAHPQVLKQCKQSLINKYSNYAQRSGEGDLVDTAAAAKALSEGALPNTTAILGPKGLAELYGLSIVDSDLQDNLDNYTTFLVVKRR